MNLTGTPEQIIDRIAEVYDDIREVLARAAAIVPPSTRAIAPYQAAALYALARPYNRSGCRVLEIGTAQGYSAAVMALALPDAHITTLNPHEGEVVLARRALGEFGRRITILERRSWDYLGDYSGEPFDVIFVDGDHKNIRLDLPWWSHLREGGMMLFHDYSPSGTPRACPPVYRALEEFKARLGRDFDYLIVDDTGVGMAGFERQPGEDFEADDRDALAKCLEYSSASFSYLTGLYRLARSTQNVDGDVVECGCQNGGSAAALLLGFGVDHVAWLFDTFTGVPEPGAEDGEKAMQRWRETQPAGWSVGDRASVAEIMRQIGAERAYVSGGDFADSLQHPYRDEANPLLAVLHIDATLYRSTFQALTAFHHQVKPGGLVIVSAYYHWIGIERAVHDFFGVHMPALNRLEKGVWWRK